MYIQIYVKCLSESISLLLVHLNHQYRFVNLLENLSHSVEFPFMFAVMPEWADCEESWQVKPGTPDAKISCKARMFPPPSTSVWSIGKKPNRTILTDDQATEDNTYQAKVNVSSFSLFLSQPSRGCQHTILPNFPKSQKLHEIERIWTPGEGVPRAPLRSATGSILFKIIFYVVESWWEHLRIHLDDW